jgi:hypothetical protein
MSRAYRIQVSEGVQRIVHVEDGVQGTIEVLPILPAERMAELLAAELERRGFARADQNDGAVLVRVGKDNVTVEVNAQTGTVTVSIAEDITLDLSAKAEATAENPESARQEAERRLQQAIDLQAVPLQGAARKAATARLEGELSELRPELDAVVNAVTGEALVEKARELGEIESIEGTVADGTLTIKVRV